MVDIVKTTSSANRVIQVVDIESSMYKSDDTLEKIPSLNHFGSCIRWNIPNYSTAIYGYYCLFRKFRSPALLLRCVNLLTYRLIPYDLKKQSNKF